MFRPIIGWGIALLERVDIRGYIGGVDGGLPYIGGYIHSHQQGGYWPLNRVDIIGTTNSCMVGIDGISEQTLLKGVLRRGGEALFRP
jgi:hypothetical protein